MKIRPWMVVVGQLAGYVISVLYIVATILIISWVFDYVESVL